MRGVAYRQPWFRGLLIAVAAVLAVVILIAATPPRPERDLTVIVPELAPSPPAPPAATPPPATARPDAPAATAPTAREPAVVERPAPVAGPTVVRKETKVVEKPAPAQTEDGESSPAPTEPPRADRSPSEHRPEPAGATYRETGLPRQLIYAGRVWQAVEVKSGQESDLRLARSDEKIDGRALLHERQDDPPYERVYLKVEGREERFVAYEPMEHGPF
jgi:hypothetical protein